ncbi:ferric reductase-like transmembrane domain-containing protein [Nocardia macrotermitis]|uniref:Ferric oxidoreductase domain-containing protein n=1 Tax=Nocardia macrotermitis TaxID=2585198 RepID=A0A7K0DB05_9NOCA|nr:ferric reductase-like transmembrane domain-containing protein [Nocardia macrotermitis]MQY22701.1 hypothetical protein [Nocardia macrotermitis]
MTSPWLWYLSRAAGVVSLILVTLIVLLGMLTSARPRPHSAATAVAMGLHRTLALGMVVFLAVHILTALVDTYVHLGWWSVLVPFAAGYRREWVALGTIAFDILLTLNLTSLLRHRLPVRVWRAVHYLAYAMGPIAIVHALTTGAPDSPVLLGVAVACGAAMALVAAWRWLSRNPDTRRRAEIAAQEWT